VILAEQKRINAEFEKEYSKNTPLDHRKKYAQFFTPIEVADLMSEWILENEDLKTILEPAFGLGIFSRIISSKKKEVVIKGFEIDQNIFSKANKVFYDSEGFNIELKNYIFNDWLNGYDGIICNPPYFKFHDFDNKRTQKEIEKNLRFNFNGFTNLYAYFLVKSIHQLNDGGRLAYILPSEFLNSDYGKSIKSYLKRSKALRHLIVIDFKENVFPDVLTTACIILCAKDSNDEEVQFSKIESVDELKFISKQINAYPTLIGNSKKIKNYDLKPNLKWRRYYENLNSDKYNQLVPFSAFGKVVRGIATGANKYFKFNKSKAENYSISEDYLLPCICRSQNVENSFFTQNDFEKLKYDDEAVYLLNAEKSNNEYVNSYLKKGEEEGVNERYLTSNRDPWYSLEDRPPAPIWVSVFNRNGLKFVRNEANISNLTTFHCIYLSNTDLFSKVNIDLLFAYLLTDIAKEIFTDNQREYGDGLKKFEPNDINKSKCLDLRLLSQKKKNSILDLYYNYRESVIKSNSSESYIEEINNILGQNFT
jgi:adenine-specific DNA-methyltransferase